ncbi:hypothetical protein Q3V23_19115 [Streptomyces sp. VNUA116]|uniref:hypothetical protein n=1 Tax=Streptomyces sp. VNUA116 TaxID=3062449 RepID=UPI0026751656|nr:hypothetical protein [Streptomyces sp. VNUA116]WKU46001.1 hypothetical protein Q3V23_19115 [Streptomyces sp. VNUA116]
MITREQLARASSVGASLLLFLVGLIMVIAGAVTGTDARLADSGSVVVFASLPLVILTLNQRQQRITREKAEVLRREGYRLGLQHASRGLLTPPPATDDSGPGAPTDTVATMPRLYAVPRCDDTPYRRAQ